MEKDTEIKKIFIKRGPDISTKKPAVMVEAPKFSLSKEKEEFKAGKSRLEKFLDFVVKLSLFALFFGLPIFFTGSTFQGIAFEKQTYFYFWTLLALVSWVIKCGYVGEMKIKRTPLDIPIVAFWVFYAAVSFFSFDRWHSVFGSFGDPSRGFIAVTAAVVAYYLLVSNLSQRLFEWIIKGFIFSGMLAIIWSLVRILDLKFIPENAINSLPISLVGSIESLTVLAGVLLVLLISWVLKIQERKDKKGISGFLTALMPLVFIILDLFLLLSLHSYVRWMGLLLGVVIFLIFILAKIVRIRESWTLVPIGAFITILVFLMIGPVRIAQIQLPVTVDIPYKTSLEISTASLKDNALLGYGPANYGYAFSKNLPAGFDNMNIRFFQGQGIILESVSTLGIIGTSLLIILILTFTGVSIHLLTKQKGENNVYSLGIVSASIMMLANVVMMKSESFTLMMWLLISSLVLAVFYRENESDEGYFNLSLKASPKYALTLAFVYILIFASVAFSFVFLGKIYAADMKMGKAAKLEKASENDSVAGMIEAISMNRREGRYYSRLSQEYLSLAREEASKDEKERSVEKVQTFFSFAIQAAKEGESLMRNDVTAVENLANVYKEAGMYFADASKLSREKYERALELEPNNPALYIYLGQAKIGMTVSEKEQSEKDKLISEAKDAYQKSLDLRKNFAPGYYNLALLQESTGELDKAIDNMSLAVNLTKDVNYAFNLGRIYQSRGKEEDNKIAENLFKKILELNPDDISTHFSLGFLYEKTNRKNEAIEEYKRVSALLPDSSQDAITQVEKMISNVRNGIANTPESLGLVQKDSQENNEDTE